MARTTLKDDVNPLSRDEIIEVNSLGPFNHSIWEGRGIKVSHEEKQAGRVKFLSNSIRAEIKKRFSRDQIATMTCFDVGCFDGWMLESLSDLPFKKLVGFEPRAENIAKGKKIREILHLPSRVEYVQAGIEGLVGHECDILICIGVLHHLSSVFDGIRALTATKPKLIFLESIMTPSSFITPELERSTELKDVVYTQTAAKFGMSAFKYESMTYPGSAATNTVVEVPTRETIEMALSVWGYSNITRPISDTTYRTSMPVNDRPAYVSILVAEPGTSVFADDPSLQEEADFATVTLPEGVVKVLIENEQKLAAAWPGSFDDEQVRTYKLSPAQASIMKALKFAPRDKVSLEIAKWLILKGQPDEAATRLLGIVTTVNPDWRACYRAFYLLTHVAPPAERALFKSRLLSCNPNYPSQLLSVSRDTFLKTMSSAV